MNYLSLKSQKFIVTIPFLCTITRDYVQRGRCEIDIVFKGISGYPSTIKKGISFAQNIKKENSGIQSSNVTDFALYKLESHA